MRFSVRSFGQGASSKAHVLSEFEHDGVHGAVRRRLRFGSDALPAESVQTKADGCHLAVLGQYGAAHRSEAPAKDSTAALADSAIVEHRTPVACHRAATA